MSHLAAARELFSRIDANAVEAGSDPVPPETIDALVGAGLFGVMTPKAVGGAELPLVDLIDVFAEVARLLAGTTSLRDGPLQRCFRDSHAASQHFLASPAATPDFARDRIAGD